MFSIDRQRTKIMVTICLLVARIITALFSFVDHGNTKSIRHILEQNIDRKEKKAITAGEIIEFRKKKKVLIFISNGKYQCCCNKNWNKP